MDKATTAAFLMIGDEILSGRTQDQNLNFLAKELSSHGIDLIEVRVVLDIEDHIIFALNELRSKYGYVFTSGGIGPTHDDITSLAVAKAFGDDLIENKTAVEILARHYGKNNLNPARIKMACVPSKATLLDNTVSAAPGFRIDNVFVMAGVPKIFQEMVKVAKKQLALGKKIRSKEISMALTESVIAGPLEDLQNQYRQVKIGSYPSEGTTSLVFRSRDYELLDQVVIKMTKIINDLKPGALIRIS